MLWIGAALLIGFGCGRLSVANRLRQARFAEECSRRFGEQTMTTLRLAELARTQAEQAEARAREWSVNE